MTPCRKHTGWRWRRAAAALLCASAWALPAGAGALAEGLTESQLRARFLLNFLRFTEWPGSTFPGPETPMTLCVLGPGDPLEGALGQLEGATAGGRKLAVRGSVDAGQAGNCQLLYVPDAQLRRLAAARESIGGRPVLIVGESEAILDHGGMIALRNVDRHLAFVVSLPSARRAALGFSPQMLNTAAEILR